MKQILGRIYADPRHDDIVQVLSRTDTRGIDELFSCADRIRKEQVGDGILLRGIVEFSNFCRKECFYCGLNRRNNHLKRYRLTREEILGAVSMIAHAHIRTVVLQSGEDDGLDAQWLKGIIEEIKARFQIAVTLSVGERSAEEFRLWRQAGADRYLLKIETSSPGLFDSLHAEKGFRQRLDALDELKRLGYQRGSGIMVGLPGQSMDALADDLLFMHAHQFDMLGIGPFIPHEHTALGNHTQGDISLTLKTVALSRILVPRAHIPATTALGSAGGDYRFEGLRAGANVLMPNFTPHPYRELYEIYPGKRCVHEPVGSCVSCMHRCAEELGRYIDFSQGDALRISHAGGRI